MKEKIAVYTCITGNYDNLKEIDKRLLEKEVDYYCFTNNKEITSKTWKVIYLEDFNLTNHMLNRKIKILGHEMINDKYDILVWMDGNSSLQKKITTFLMEQCHLDDYSFCAFKHPDRDCIYEEAKACVRLKKDNKDIITKQMEFYRNDNYPEHNGLCEMSIFVKKAKDKKVIETMNLWYEMITKYSKRDQLSFMWCVAKTNLKLEILPLVVRDNPYFKLDEHITKINDLGNYRLYFGNSIDLEFDRIIDGIFEKWNDIYEVNTKIVKDCCRIEFELGEVPFVVFDKLDIKTGNKIKNIIYYNFCEIDDKKIFYNSNPVILIEGNFKKNTDIKLSIELKKLSNQDLMNLLMEQAEKEKIKRKKLKQEYIRKVEILQKENEDLKRDNEKWFRNYHQVVDSRGWKILEFIRKFKEKLKIE